MDREAFEVRCRGRATAFRLLSRRPAAVLRSEAIARTHGHRLHSIGVTWTTMPTPAASAVEAVDPASTTVVPFGCSRWHRRSRSHRWNAGGAVSPRLSLHCATPLRPLLRSLKGGRRPRQRTSNASRPWWRRRVLPSTSTRPTADGVTISRVRRPLTSLRTFHYPGDTTCTRRSQLTGRSAPSEAGRAECAVPHESPANAGVSSLPYVRRLDRSRTKPAVWW